MTGTPSSSRPPWARSTQQRRKPSRSKSALARKGDKPAERVVFALLELRAEVAIRIEGDLAAAVGTYQQLLDAYPSSPRSEWVEKRIKDLLGGHTNELDAVENWEAAIKTCDERNIHSAHGMLRRRMQKSGLKAIDELAADLEKACHPPTKATVRAFADLYANLARDAALHDDCERYQAFYKKYLESNGSVSEMISWSKHAPWCDLGDLRNDVTWLKAMLDRHWSFEMPMNLTSHRDQKGLAMYGHTDGPRVPEGKEESFYLRLERQPDGQLKCAQASWRRYWGKSIEGTCEVKFTRLVPVDGLGFDEGTFSVKFTGVELADGSKGNTELTAGDFRVRRQ